MQNFIVLGIVPGTDFQITFSFWLAAAGTLAALPVAVQMWRKRYAFIALARARKIARLITQAQFQLPA